MNTASCGSIGRMASLDFDEWEYLVSMEAAVVVGSVSVPAVVDSEADVEAFDKATLARG